MPLCQGLPTGPCPFAANDAHVKSTQGDLFLCSSCEETRFPYILVKGKSGRSGRNQNQNPPVQTSKSSSVVEVQCTGCDKSCDRAECVQCDICSENYDQQCSALPKAVFSTLLLIAHVCGWVCYNCRKSCKAKLEKAQASQSAITEEMAKLSCTVKQVCDDIDKIESKLQHITHTDGQPVPADLPETDHIKSCVIKTMEDISRRERNVIVVGLPEQQGFDDTELFTSFCEVNLTIKPAVVGCRRLGPRVRQSTNQQQPRRLLVKLRTAETASNLCRASRDLKRSNDPTVSSVYINPDLTKEQALFAYQERQKRRARLSQPSTSDVPASTGNDYTQPFH